MHDTVVDPFHIPVFLHEWAKYSYSQITAYGWLTSFMI